MTLKWGPDELDEELRREELIKKDAAHYLRNQRRRLGTTMDEKKTGGELAKEMANKMSDFVNNLNTEPLKDFVGAMASEHRTLQQNFTRLCFMWIEHLASLPEGHWDLRNEDSVHLSNQMVGYIKREHTYPPSKLLRHV